MAQNNPYYKELKSFEYAGLKTPKGLHPSFKAVQLSNGNYCVVPLVAPGVGNSLEDAFNYPVNPVNRDQFDGVFLFNPRLFEAATCADPNLATRAQGIIDEKCSGVMEGLINTQTGNTLNYEKNCMTAIGMSTGFMYNLLGRICNDAIEANPSLFLQDDSQVQ